jgi:hypothetical protein
MQGRDGFLFLNGRDSNNLVGYLTGAETISRSTRTIHRHNRAVIEGLGLPFLGIIVPEAHCVYPEHLPDGIVISEARPVRQVLDDMAPGYHYALPQMTTFKAQGGVAYTGRDSHWTQPAALECYRDLRGRIGRSHDLDLAYTPSVTAETGDLSIKSPQEVVAAEREHAKSMLTYFNVFASQILNHGNVLVLHNPKGRGRCLAFGTSFSTRLVPAYASDFAEVVFCYGTTVDAALVDLVKPDCVISELPERFLHFPSYSVDGSTLISLLLGLHDHIGTSAAVLAPVAKVPERVCALGTFFGGANDRAMGRPALAFMRLLETSNPDLALRVALLAPFLTEPMEKTGLRLLLSGQFYNRGLLAQVSKFVDEGLLDIGRLPLVPDSEAGLLTQIRMQIRAGLHGQAVATLDRLETAFSDSPESQYYATYLRH